MPNFSNIGLQEPSTITNRVAAVTINRGGTNEQQEILVLGDSESSGAVARVLNQAPNSTEWGLVVRPVGDSTQMAVSSVAGVVSVSPVSTASVRVAQSSAADLQATVTPASTVWAVQAAQSGSWTVRANLSSTSADNPVSAVQSGAWSVTASNFSTTVNISSVAGKVAVVNSSAADLNVTVAGYSTTANVSSLAGRVSIAAQHDSAGIINVADSTNNALRVNVVAGAAGGSTQVTVSQLLDSSNGTVTVGDSVNQALRVNVVAGAAGGSTIVTVSTGSVRVHQSTAADLQTTATQGGTWSVRGQDGAGNALESSTSAPSSGARGLLVRPVLNALQTYSDSTTGQSSATTILSSAAATCGYVYAYSVISTVAGPVEWAVYSGATRLWGGVLAAVSSAVSGAVLAVSPPAYLFKGSTGQPLTFNCVSSNRGLSVSLGYWIST